MTGPIIRITLRYIVGAVIGLEAGSALAGDPDVVIVAAATVGAVTEATYATAKKRGWVT
jgi:hypothetical protein